MSIAERMPIPAGLAPEWEQPGDEDGFWMHDRMHFPNAITVLEDDLIRTIYEYGFNSSSRDYDLPARMHGRRFWAHHYVMMMPATTSPEELADLARSAERKVGEAMMNMRSQWDDVSLPEVKEHLRFWQEFNLTSAAMPDLLAHLDESVRRIARLWHIHFATTTPAYLAISLFDELYHELFEDASTFEPYELLQGFDNKTLEADRELWRLSRRARLSPIVRSVLASYPAKDVIGMLDRSDEGQAFQYDLIEYLDRYGQRGDTWGFSQPTWAEDPTQVIRTLQSYVDQPNRDLKGEAEQLAAAREGRIAEARRRLAAYPEAVRGQFEMMLQAAQIGVVLSEDHGFYIDFWSSAEARRMFLEFGRRFAGAGVIEDPNDVFHLRLNEIRDTAGYLPTIDRRSLVAERKAEMERYADITLPPAVGTPPAAPPPNTPETRLMMKFFGGPPPAPVSQSELQGSAGSPGVVQGRARIIRAIAEAGSLQPGDILVAETTAPPWTPLFATAAAVVTDTGGILSHCAVVAREYRIPAVVGTGVATTMIPDGALIEVDGDRGIVRIVG